MAKPLLNILEMYPVHGLFSILSGIISFCNEKMPLIEGENLK